MLGQILPDQIHLLVRLFRIESKEVLNGDSPINVLIVFIEHGYNPLVCLYDTRVVGASFNELDTCLWSHISVTGVSLKPCLKHLHYLGNKFLIFIENRHLMHHCRGLLNGRDNLELIEKVIS